ncbi:MAG: hypothetical protein QF578_06605 [Alphaproteobacteria bacterium]|nr:hypothetical protein [Alphaproteobacteria bacterium]MDP6814695.1 hypothetical protein [Alphaproteobacteria bacterium]
MSVAKPELAKAAWWRPDLPLPILLVLLAVGIGLAAGLDAGQVQITFRTGFGRALGDFALILLPSFLIAANMSRRPLPAIGGWVRLISPFSAAGMICHVTAYAALAPIAGRNRLSMAMAAYAGFMLLVPAGPLIVGAALGVDDPGLLLVGLLLLLPVWLAGEVWLRLWRTHDAAAAPEAPIAAGEWRAFTPFAVLAGLLVLGWSTDLAAWPVVDFFTRPKGALLAAALWSYLDTPAEHRREGLESAVGRTSGLLIVVGAASAVGAMATAVVPIERLLPGASGQAAALIGLFAIAALMKTLQGSSMATFAAVAPLVLPLIEHMQIPPVAAVYAICLGAFVAILPNDGYYWVVRREALERASDGAATFYLAGASVCQALTGLVLLLLLLHLGLV